MAKVVKDDSNCHIHDLAIKEMEMEIETLQRHHANYKKDIDSLFTVMQDFKVSLVKIDNKLENLGDVQSRLRKVEDKSIFIDFLNKLSWLAVGALIAGFISQSFVATKEKHDYSIIKDK